MTETCPRCDREIPIVMAADGYPTTYRGPCDVCRSQLRASILGPWNPPAETSSEPN